LLLDFDGGGSQAFRAGHEMVSGHIPELAVGYIHTDQLVIRFGLDID
jgi:hypothetical protein